MATLTELEALLEDATLLAKIRAAVCIAAESMLAGTPTAADRKWAKAVFFDPSIEAKKCLRYIIGKNSAATVAQITGATDNTIQTQVNEAAVELALALSNQ
jgi:hypothetical protein